MSAAATLSALALTLKAEGKIDEAAYLAQMPDIVPGCGIIVFDFKKYRLCREPEPVAVPIEPIAVSFEPVEASDMEGVHDMIESSAEADEGRHILADDGVDVDLHYCGIMVVAVIIHTGEGEGNMDTLLVGDAVNSFINSMCDRLDKAHSYLLHDHYGVEGVLRGVFAAPAKPALTRKHTLTHREGALCEYGHASVPTAVWSWYRVHQATIRALATAPTAGYAADVFARVAAGMYRFTGTVWMHATADEAWSALDGEYPMQLMHDVHVYLCTLLERSRMEAGANEVAHATALSVHAGAPFLHGVIAALRVMMPAPPLVGIKRRWVPIAEYQPAAKR